MMTTYLKRFKFQNFLVFLLITLDALLTVAATVFLANQIDALVAKNLHAFILWVLLDLLAWILDAIVNRLCDVRIESTIQSQLNAVRGDIVRALAQMEYQDFRKNSKEDYNSWLHNDMSQLYDDGFRQIYWAYEGITAMILASVALVYFHWLLLTSTLILSVILFYLPNFFKRRLKKVAQEVSEVNKQALDKTTDYLTGFEVLFHDNQMNHFSQKIMSVFQIMKKTKVRRTQATATVNAVLRLSSVSANITISAIAGYLIFTKSIGNWCHCDNN